MKEINIFDSNIIDDWALIFLKSILVFNELKVLSTTSLNLLNFNIFWTSVVCWYYCKISWLIK
ncbi:hypothetical protein [Mycoplasmopsis felis]|uniref:hypothetical protein n=1 Tax=Mycoplasmopsis felis TaxID=33923 RepID=UPI002AFFA674|nr:hypothetical protein [Mycoplasmopsis felis]WQQ10191.1 hypothetical protein RRG49_00355 [Mycoplasmopsis felis]